MCKNFKQYDIKYSKRTKEFYTMNLIDTTKELKSACKILKKQKVIAIDCEFIREKTYYPIPCLIQVGYEDGAFLIDPLAKDVDYEEFFNLLQNKKIMKGVVSMPFFYQRDKKKL